MRVPLSFAALLLLSACAGESADREERSVTVVAEPVELLAEEEVIEAIGTARATRSAELYPEVSGQVRKVRFSAGSFVQSGQSLIELDSRSERLALRLAQVRVKEAEQLLSRYRRIEDTGALSESQIEEGETALAAAQIQRDLAQDALAERTIRAPFSGHISLSEIDVGDRVTPTTLIAQLDQRSRLFVDFNAPESVFQRLKPGGTVEVVPFSKPDRTIAAKVEAVDSTIEQEQRSYTVRSLISNQDDSFRPGMSFSVRFVGSGQLRAAVPEASVVWSGDGSSIFAVRDGKAQRVPVTIASRRDGLALLDAQVEKGTLIIVEGVQKVREGQAVELVKPMERPAAQVETEPAQ
ncbi:efflux RND transporter periplasmic adaptor subunit [Erythrobacter insulae]|uniref:Efflux RND transporter periplasmic adaptor subunit n=1 Tax=Erythrobacter insulae TaxID=2584124 RepID=A0A547PCD7_9SPHN|nr:efflux RND transporter periplasmic adaptor subunit [Erythrobacter insulae]TRD11793.1 efflux RND transporter periplasmic adaptor subunit [Erythrobacter insulae]